MVSAVNIENLDKEEVMEHFFNDVKYATVSLEKDINQIKEQFKESVFELSYIPMKRRLTEEYKLFMRPTYEFLQFEKFSFSQKSVASYMRTNKEFFETSLGLLDQLNCIGKRFSVCGIKNCNTYRAIVEVIDMCSLLEETYPTRYWFEQKKYDFMQEMMNESQTMVEELNAVVQKMNLSWDKKVLDYESVEALDYVIEKNKAGLKLFDLTFHKSKKMIKDLFIDTSKTFNDEELESLHQCILTYKKNEFWVSRNLNRIAKILGDNYKGQETDFMKLRNDYALVQKFATVYLDEESSNVFLATLQEKEKREEFFELVFEGIRVVRKFQYFDLIQRLPLGECEIEQIDLSTLYHVCSSFYLGLSYLEQDLLEVSQYCRAEQETFPLEEMRKLLYALERVDEKRSFLNEHKLLIHELFGDTIIGSDTDWNTLREHVIRRTRPALVVKEEVIIETVEQNTLEENDETNVQEYTETERQCVRVEEVAQVEEIDSIVQEVTVLEDNVQEEQHEEETKVQEFSVLFGTMEQNASYVQLRPVVSVKGDEETVTTISRTKTGKKNGAKKAKNKTRMYETRSHEIIGDGTVPAYLIETDYTIGEPFPEYKEATFEQFVDVALDRCSTQEAMDYVLSMEAPMREDMLLKKLAVVLQLVRATPSLKEEVSQLLYENYHGYILKDGFVTRKDGFEQLRLRRPAETEGKRDIATVSKEELQAATLTLLSNQEELTLDVICKEIASVLGYPRRTKKFNEIVEKAVRELQKNDVIVRNSGGYCIS